MANSRKRKLSKNMTINKKMTLSPLGDRFQFPPKEYAENMREATNRRLSNIKAKIEICEENYHKQQQLYYDFAFQIQTTVEALSKLDQITLQGQINSLETQWFLLLCEPTNNLENTNELNKLEKQISVLENLENNTDGSASQIKDQILLLNYQQTNCALQLEIYNNEKLLLSYERKILLDKCSELQNEIKKIVTPTQTSNEDFIDLTTYSSPLLAHSLLSNTSTTSTTSTESDEEEKFVSQVLDFK